MLLGGSEGGFVKFNVTGFQNIIANDYLNPSVQ